MTIQGLVDSGMFAIVNEGEERSREISTVFCCDLLSIAMGRAPAGCAWVTVMGNMNTLAVAALADAACIIMAEGATLDDLLPEAFGCHEEGQGPGDHGHGDGPAYF